MASDERELRDALEKAHAALKKTRAELEEDQSKLDRSYDDLAQTRRKLLEAQERERLLSVEFEKLKRELVEHEHPPPPEPRRVPTDFVTRVILNAVAAVFGAMGAYAFTAGAAGLGVVLIGAGVAVALEGRRQ